MALSGRPLLFQLFVSSTFTDMKREREILQTRVFPKLRDYCKGRGASFSPVDLRWGIAEEASHDQQTMNICLRELKRCQDMTPGGPNFLILMGDRYGWRPLPPQVPADEFEELKRVLTTDPAKRRRDGPQRLLPSPGRRGG
jgi:hypothetical protein